MKRLQTFFTSRRKEFIISSSVGLLVVLMMANLSALIDQVVHPEISYFDGEHLIVGGITAIIIAALYILLMIYVSNLKTKEREVRKLNEELELKVEERTRQLIDTQGELVRSEKLIMFGLIAGNMGNELRNPLGVMSNAVYFLEAVLSDAGSTVREYLEIIKSEIGNSQRIIDELLDFFRDKPLRTEVIFVHELIHQSLERVIIPVNIRLLADLPESLPSVKVDPLQIGQVFRNLIANAVQAMPDGGSLRVRARKVQGSEVKIIEHRTSNVEPETDFIVISVTDTGTGVAPENMAKLFQPLFTTKSRGIGLGLAISRKLIEANGGRIEAESSLGDGATFTVTLPVGEE